MYYQIEMFEEMDIEELQESVNKFLLLLPSERIKDLSFNEKVILLSSGEMKKVYYAVITYTYIEE